MEVILFDCVNSGEAKKQKKKKKIGGLVTEV